MLEQALVALALRVTSKRKMNSGSAHHLVRYCSSQFIFAFSIFGQRFYVRPAEFKHASRLRVAGRCRHKCLLPSRIRGSYAVAKTPLRVKVDPQWRWLANMLYPRLRAANDIQKNPAPSDAYPLDDLTILADAAALIDDNRESLNADYDFISTIFALRARSAMF